MNPLTYSIDCPYCQQPMTTDDVWKVCHTCRFEFEINSKDGLHLKFYCDMNEMEWALNLYPESNKTYLWGAPIGSTEIDDPITAIRFKFIVPHVTPTNVADKIKTLLTFS